MLNVDTLLNRIVAAMSIGLLATIVVGWLLSYRDMKAAPVGPGKWIFALPAWAQIGGGLAITALLGYLGYALWIPLPLTAPTVALKILRIWQCLCPRSTDARSARNKHWRPRSAPNTGPIGNARGGFCPA